MSAIVNLPATGPRLGFQFFCDMKEILVALHDAGKHLGDKPPAIRPKTFSPGAHLRLLENVVPKRRLLVQAQFLGHRAIRPRCNFIIA